LIDAVLRFQREAQTLQGFGCRIASDAFPRCADSRVMLDTSSTLLGATIASSENSPDRMPEPALAVFRARLAFGFDFIEPEPGGQRNLAALDFGEWR